MTETMHITEILRQMDEHRTTIIGIQDKMHELVEEFKLYSEYYDDSITSLESAIYNLKEVCNE